MKTTLPALFATFGVLVAQQPNGAGVNSPWTPAEVIQIDDLRQIVAKKQTSNVYHIGFERFYKSKHIPGTTFAGEGRTDAGLAELKKAVANVPKDAQIVLYCGCCPWDHCPNMKPAYNLLRSLGYTKIRVTEIPNSFQKDWTDKGYPVEGASASNGN